MAKKRKPAPPTSAENVLTQLEQLLQPLLPRMTSLERHLLDSALKAATGLVKVVVLHGPPMPEAGPAVKDFVEFARDQHDVDILIKERDKKDAVQRQRQSHAHKGLTIYERIMEEKRQDPTADDNTIASRAGTTPGGFVKAMSRRITSKK